MNKKIVVFSIITLLLSVLPAMAFVPAGLDIFSDKNVVSLFNHGQNVSLDKPVNKLNFKDKDKYCAEHFNGYSTIKTGQENGVMFVPLSPVYLALIEEQKRTPHYCLGHDSVMVGRNLVWCRELRKNQPNITVQLRIMGSELLNTIRLSNYTFAYKIRQNPGDCHTNSIALDKPYFFTRIKFFLHRR